MKRELGRRLSALEAKPERPMPPGICMEHLTPEQNAAILRYDEHGDMARVSNADLEVLATLCEGNCGTRQHECRTG